MAPEVLARLPYYGQEVDLFSLAAILFVLYSGSFAFTQANPKED